jgi:hypothetical protein
MPSCHIVMQRPTFPQRDPRQVAHGGVSRLSYGFWHFAGLAGAETDAPFLITYDNERRKSEPLTAFDDLSNAIDVNELVDEFGVSFFTRGSFAMTGFTPVARLGYAAFSYRKITHRIGGRFVRLRFTSPFKVLSDYAGLFF